MSEQETISGFKRRSKWAIGRRRCQVKLFGHFAAQLRWIVGSHSTKKKGRKVFEVIYKYLLVSRVRLEMVEQYQYWVKRLWVSTSNEKDPCYDQLPIIPMIKISGSLAQIFSRRNMTHSRSYTPHLSTPNEDASSSAIVEAEVASPVPQPLTSKCPNIKELYLPKV